MFYESPRFPAHLAYGALLGPTWSTDIFITQSGGEGRNINWSQPRYRMEIAFLNRSLAETEALVSFVYGIAQGQGNAFRVKDPSDFAGTDEPLGLGNGVQTVFQLIKRYTIGAYTFDRIITKPVNGTITAKVNNVLTGAFVADTTTGLVTFTTPPPPTEPVTASYEFDVPMRLTSDWLPIRATGPQTFSVDSIELLEVRELT